MGDLQAPIINWQVKASKAKAGFTKQRVLLIGQGSGNMRPKGLIEDLQESEATDLLGAHSLTRLAFDRFRKYNKRTDIDVIPLAAPTGATKPKSVITIAGECTQASNLRFRLGDDQFVFEVGVPLGSSPASVVVKIIAAINASTAPFTATEFHTQIVVSPTPSSSDSPPAPALDTSAEDATKLNVEFDIEGTAGNGLIARVDTRVSGIGLSMPAMSGGSGAYSTTGIFTNVTARYQTIIFDNTLSLPTVSGFLTERAALENTVKSGVGVTMRNGSTTELKAFAETKNAQYMVIFGNPNEMKLNLIPLLAAAEFGAKRALRLTEGAPLGNLTLDPQETYGGAEKASLPYHNTPMSYKAPYNQLSLAQLEDLNDAGISVIVPSASQTVLGAVVTTYKRNIAGVDDVTFRYLNSVDTSVAIQEYFFSNCQSEFGQTRATTGELVDGVSMTNTLSIKSFLVGLYVDLIDKALAQGGAEAVKAFKNRLLVTLDPATGIYSVNAPVAIVSQFRGLNGVVEINFDFK